MVGGRVIEVCGYSDRPDVLFVDVADRPYSRIETCAVNVERNETSERIEVGDSLWWQCGWCYWTPQNSHRQKCGVDFDIKIPKVGYSGIVHPASRPSPGASP